MFHIFNLENKSDQRLLAFNKLDTESEKKCTRGIYEYLRWNNANNSES